MGEGQSGMEEGEEEEEGFPSLGRLWHYPFLRYLSCSHTGQSDLLLLPLFLAHFLFGLSLPDMNPQVEGRSGGDTGKEEERR